MMTPERIAQIRRLPWSQAGLEVEELCDAVESAQNGCRILRGAAEAALDREEVLQNRIAQLEGAMTTPDLLAALADLIADAMVRRMAGTEEKHDGR